MQTLIMVVQFVLGLSIIVGIHELGHLLFAKLFGMRVESYTIGFPPRLIKFKWGETEYGIGAIPFGGAVKIAGMIDESLDTDSINNAPQHWEYRSKPAWQRLIVMVGGIFFNAVSGILIYICLTLLVGDTYLSKQEVNQYGILPTEMGRMMGFEEGDKIINIHGRDFTNFADVFAPATLLANQGYYTVERNGQQIRIAIPENFIEKLTAEKQFNSFIGPRIPFAIGDIQPGEGAEAAGLCAGDRILSINDKPTLYFNQLQAILEASIGQNIQIAYERDGHLYHTTAQVNKAGKLGFCSYPLLKYETKDYTLGEAIVVGTSKAVEVLRTNLLGLIKIITGKISAAKSVSGPIGIAQIFGNQFNWLHFWNIVGFLSIVLAFTNLLPIPALDGGHIVLVAYELITGRKVPEAILLTIQKVGLVIVVLLIGYGVFNDLRKLF